MKHGGRLVSKKRRRLTRRYKRWLRRYHLYFRRCMVWVDEETALNA